MKRFVELSVGIAFVFLLVLSLQPSAIAQVYGDFDTVRQIRNVPYEPLDDYTGEIMSFGLPPTWLPDYDDGYSQPIPIGFPFEFAGEVYYQLYVCVNGFVTFSAPPNSPAKDPTALFYENTAYPKNVLAVFWGDHIYRQPLERFYGYKPTRVLYKSDPENGVFIVEWRYLNINYLQPNNDTVKSSVATFQLRLYKSTDPYSAQGDIEFAYGQVGGNEYSNDTRVITRNSSVGIKGEFSPADFLNGLEYGKDPYIARTSMRLTNEWAPSGGTDYRIRFRSKARFNVEEFWGDGDVDLSKGYNRKHWNMPQSRYVTVNDARLILRSIATGVKLDSVRRREAYHGDVNHNGRYYYDINGVRKEIKWRNKYYGDSLPAEIGSLKQIFYQVNAYDAALIMHYMSARIPELPWLYDTIPQYGKLSAFEYADNIRFGQPQLSGNSYLIPIYLNGYYDGPISIVMDLNVDAEVLLNTENIIYEKFGSKIVVAGSGEFDLNQPILYLQIDKNNDLLILSDIEFNEEVKNGSAIVLSTNDNSGEFSLNVNPNPIVAGNVNFTVNVNQAGNYKLEIFDVSGNVVKTLNLISDGSLQSTLNWNCIDVNGNKLGSGIYFVRLSGNNQSVVEKIVVNW
ncbi:MAG: T9SS type A sorting domain-containing protein [Candidatus Kapaibacteriales bacterium]